VNPFNYQRVASPQEAINAVAAEGAAFLGGGTNLVDLMKSGIEHPTKLIDITRLNLTKITMSATGATLIEAGARNSAIANHEIIRTHYPLLAHAILSGASTQLRNMATAGGNLLQRTRCPYFMEAAFHSCNKRSPGSGCAAIEGLNRWHAILGTSENCIATNPSDMAVALSSLGAAIHILGPSGERVIAIDDFYRLPGNTPQIETDLSSRELIIGIELPKPRFARNSWYLKVRDRESYAFALVSVAAGLELQDGIIESAGLALGGVAPKPWRSLDAESFLAGRTPTIEAFRHAAEIALRAASSLRHNGFKVGLAKHTVVRALMRAAG
jgi:xanthine dehydrogenase YagS FAD-binding subunit